MHINLNNKMMEKIQAIKPGPKPKKRMGHQTREDVLHRRQNLNTPD